MGLRVQRLLVVWGRALRSLLGLNNLIALRALGVLERLSKPDTLKPQRQRMSCSLCACAGTVPAASDVLPLELKKLGEGYWLTPSGKLGDGSTPQSGKP